MQLLHFSSVFTIRIDYIKYKSYKSSSVKTNETFWWSECSAQLMLHFMNSKVVEKLKKQSQRRYCPDQSKKDTYEIWYITISTTLSCTQSNANLEQLYATLSSNILMYMEKLLLMDIAQKIIWNTYDKPKNSCVHSYMMNRDECLMNINILMKNTPFKKKSDEKHNNILMVRMFT